MAPLLAAPLLISPCSQRPRLSLLMIVVLILLLLKLSIILVRGLLWGGRRCCGVTLIIMPGLSSRLGLSNGRIIGSGRIILVVLIICC